MNPDSITKVELLQLVTIQFVALAGLCPDAAALTHLLNGTLVAFQMLPDREKQKLITQALDGVKRRSCPEQN